MNPLMSLIVTMLTHSCGMLSEQDGFNETEKFNGGYQQYIIDTHCVRFTISANHDRTKDAEDPSAWDVRDWAMTPI